MIGYQTYYLRKKKMKPILKWTGGKSSEISIIKEHMPKNYERFVEPFLGGGALFFHLEHKKSILNDFNKELISFYSIINTTKDLEEFRKIIEVVIEQRKQASALIGDTDFIKNAIAINNDEIYQKYLKREMVSKEKIIARIDREKKEKEEQLLTEEEKHIHRVTGVNAALYYYCRELYNHKLQSAAYDVEHIAYWFVMREIAYSGMFRYANGKFNVPYGGISYNKKNLLTKLNEILLLSKKDFYKKAEFNNGDFEQFFIKYDYFSENDFIFLDPPYDSEFSQYNKEEDFTKEDQIRLRNTLLKTKAKIMVVIKETEFINDLYKEHFKVEKFEKNYSVNFKNRNDREVSHLIIKNY